MTSCHVTRRQAGAAQQAPRGRRGVSLEAGPDGVHITAKQRTESAGNDDVASVTRRIVKISQERDWPWTEIGLEMSILSLRNVSHTVLSRRALPAFSYLRVLSASPVVSRCLNDKPSRPMPQAEAHLTASG